MTWSKFSDTYRDDPPWLEVGPLAHHLHTMAVVWSNDKLTDGLIPDAVWPSLVCWDGLTERVGNRTRPVTASALLDRLVTAGVVSTPQRAGRTPWLSEKPLPPAGYSQLDWGDQPTKEQVVNRNIELSAKRAAAGRKGGKRSVENRRERFGTAQPGATIEAHAEAPHRRPELRAL